MNFGVQCVCGHAGAEQATVIGVDRHQRVAHPPDHLLRHLRSRRIVEVEAGLAIVGKLKGRELGTGSGNGKGGHDHSKIRRLTVTTVRRALNRRISQYNCRGQALARPTKPAYIGMNLTGDRQ